MASPQSARLGVPKRPPPAGLPDYPPRKKPKVSILGADHSDVDYLIKLSSDILLEIFCQLEPIDVLHLSRTSKKLRHLIASGSFTSVWKAAYDNISTANQPPLCPDNFNIFHYTNFLFGRHCQFCATTDHGQLHHNTALVRICHNCVKERLVDKDSVKDTEVANLCHSWEISWRRSHHILRIEYTQRHKELHAKKGEERTEYCNVRQTMISDRCWHAEALKKWQDGKDGATLAQVRKIIPIPKFLFPVGKHRQAESRKHDQGG